MNVTALPYWMEVVRAIGPAAGSLLVFLTAAIAAIVAWKTYRQRKAADERAEWWRRTQWAIDYASDHDLEKGRIGLRTLRFLMSSDLASPEDKSMVKDVLAVTIAAHQSRTYNGSTDQRPAEPRRRRLFPWTSRGE
jgi:hypothetical protein